MIDIGMPLQLAVERAILEVAARQTRGDETVDVTIDVNVAEFPHPAMTAYQRDFTRLYSNLIIFLILAASFVVQANQLATEKDLKLKLQMRVMGTKDGPMWASWIATFWAMSVLSSLVLVACIHLFQLKFITESDFSVYYTLFLLAYLAHVSFACFISSLTSRAGIVRGICLGFVLPILFAYTYFDAVLFTDLVPPIVATLLSPFPPFIFLKGVTDIVQHAPSGGFRWSQISDNAYQCPSTCAATFPGCKCRYFADRDAAYIFPLQEVFNTLAIEMVVYLLLALYFEQVTTAPGYGRAQPAHFFLMPSYWLGQTDTKPDPKDLETDETDEGLSVHPDVAAETTRVLEEARSASGTRSEGDALLIVNLKKVFTKKVRPGDGEGWFSQKFTAVARINLGIKDNTLFCLLGHNGAGKTTTFSMLAGILPPTRGDAFIFGKSVRRQLRGVQAMMGLCPQHDVLWAELTAYEHLHLFAGLSGVAQSEIAPRVTSFLEQVDLTRWQNEPSKKYSGGMKRRLSVANALISAPRVVYLDEPTTGMDPVNRRGVWDVIEKAKHGRVVVLTTHAMEEAETLGDQIGIMSRGRLLCLGTSLHLKSEYGTGYTVDVTCDEAAVQEVQQVVQKHAQAVVATGRGLSAKVPQKASAETLPALFRELDAAKSGGLALNTALNMCTLEEVFIKLAEEAQDPEWLLLKYGEVEKLAAWEKCIPKRVREHKAKVAELEERKKQGMAGEELTVGGMAPGEVQADDEEILANTLEFVSPKFKTQNKALSTKINQFQKKQKNSTNACSACTIYPLMFVFVAESIVSLILGSPVIQCAKNETDSLVQFKPLVMPPTDRQSLNWALTNPGVRATSDLISDLGYLENANNFQENCVDKYLDEDREYVPVGTSASGEVEQVRMSEVDVYEVYTTWAYQAACTYRPQEKPPDELPLSAIEYALYRQGCDMAVWKKLYANYSYARIGTYANVCREEGNPTMNFTYEVGGVNVTVMHENMKCPEAISEFKRTCTAVKRPPANCPRNITAEDEQEEAQTDPGTQLGFGGAPRLGTVQELAQKYECRTDAASAILDYDSSADLLSVLFDANPIAHVVQCVAARMCAVGGTCAAGANKFAAISASFPQCTGIDVFDQGSGAFASLTDEQIRGMGYAGLQADPDAAAYYLCAMDAYAYCRFATAYEQCPGLVKTATAKMLPYSSSLSASEYADLGSLRYDLSGLQPSDCEPNCFAAMLGLQPVETTGVLSHFGLDAGESYYGEPPPEISRGLAFLQLDCIEFPATGRCDVSREQLDAHLFSHWKTANRTDISWTNPNTPIYIIAALQEGAYQGAFHFEKWSLPSTTFNYTVLYNGTFFPSQIITELGFGWLFSNVEAPALMHRIHSALFKTLSDQPHVELEGSTMVFPKPPGTFSGFSLTRLISPILLPYVGAALYPIACWALVSEKAAKLREIMTMSGLQRGTYLWINYTNYLGMYLMQTLVVFLFMYLFPRVGAAQDSGGQGFKIFADHDWGVILVLWLLYGLATLSFAFWNSTLFADKYLGVIVPGFVIVITNITSYILTENALQTGDSSSMGVIISGFLPMYAMTNALQILAAASGDAQGKNGVRISWNNVGQPEYAGVLGAMVMLAISTVVYTFLFIYCDMVLPIGPGVKKHPLFFFKGAFWAPSKFRPAVDMCKRPPEPSEGDDVSAERARAADGDGASNQVTCLGLRKVYPGASTAAVVNVQFGIKHQECFGLLGSNGAGKSTTIHILCGLHAPTEGTVLVQAPDGPQLDIRTDLTTIQAAMGVCPQDNLLWDDLTGDQHLQFFGRLRGLPEGRKSNTLKKHIAYWLKRVNLATRSTKRKPSKAYSGGMKRRLSVATSFVGNPRLVYLDEPSTGLDPESRRQLWYAIRAAKRDKSLILTTHALEEADALCDRIGIMTFGQMRVLGSPSELRIRFDQGYKLMISAAVLAQDATHKLVLSLAPRAGLRDAINGVRVYQVDKEDVQIDALFEGIEAAREELGIQDWGLSQTSLEEVFLTIVNSTAPPNAITA